jgi:hypothetical protein
MFSGEKEYENNLLMSMISDLWIRVLPAILIQKLGPLGFIVIGYLVEKKFVGRIPTFSNALAINLHVYTINNPPQILVWYANIGIIIGVLALISYGVRQPLSRFFYFISWAYSSIIVGFIILITST